MKKRLHLVILMVLATITGFAQQQPQTGDVIYVYQKDGQIDAFLRSEITEFYYGFEDEYGITHNDIQMQWIVMEDSICKIPLANIDSISFVTPPTVYQPGVIRIEEGLMDYVVSSDFQTLTFEIAANTPSNLIPKVGDKLVTLVQNDKFPVGFAGKVTAVNGTTVQCEMPPIREIFDTYYSITSGGVYEETNTAEAKASTRTVEEAKPKVFKFKPKKAIEIDKTLDLTDLIDEDEFTLSGKPSLKMSLMPDFEMKIVFMVNKLIDYKLSCDFKGDIDSHGRIGVYGKAHFEKEFIDKGIPLFVIPVLEVPLIVGKFRVSPFVEVDGEVTTGYDFSHKSHIKASMECGGFGHKSKRPSGSVSIIEQKVEPDDVSLSGSVNGGLLAEFSLCLLKEDIAKLALTYKAGAKFSSNFVFHPKDVVNAKKNTNLYDKLKDVMIDVHGPYELSVNYSTGEELFDLEGTLFTIIDEEPKLGSFHVVPTFRSMSFEQNYASSKSANAFVGITANPTCLLPVQTGLRVTDSEGNIAGEWMSNEKMDVKKSIGSMTNTFENLSDDKDYKLNPTLNVMGIEMLASPSEDLDRNKFPVRIVSFEQTGAHYSKQKGYEYEGVNYFYKFNATTTVEISDEVYNVKDWGYIYHDIYGVDKKISCANLTGLIYSDERYAYYFNGPERTVRLSPYIQYENQTEINTGKEKIFGVEYDHDDFVSCPDSNHPHAIDLGLPSGTLWSCCNVGANYPEEKGGHYLWADTSPVSSIYYKHTEDSRTETEHDDGNYESHEPFDEYWTYDYLESSDTWTAVGTENHPLYNKETGDIERLDFDIRGTKYDAATTTLGGAWRLPTAEQARELAEYCTVKAFNNGGILYRVTGPNGRSIIVPNNYSYHHEYDRTFVVRIPGGPMRQGLKHIKDVSDYEAHYRTNTGTTLFLSHSKWANLFSYTIYESGTYTQIRTDYKGSDMPLGIRPVLKK